MRSVVSRRFRGLSQHTPKIHPSLSDSLGSPRAPSCVENAPPRPTVLPDRGDADGENWHGIRLSTWITNYNYAMKKTVFAIATIMVFAINANAQMRTPASEQVSSFGIRGGVNFFNWGGDDGTDNDYTNRAGFHAGIFGNMFVTDGFSIEPGAYYSVKGTAADNIVDSRAVLTYVDVPILLRFYAT